MVDIVSKRVKTAKHLWISLLMF